MSHECAAPSRLFVRHFTVASRDDLDEEIAGWVREVYAAGAVQHRTADVSCRLSTHEVARRENVVAAAIAWGSNASYTQ